MANYGFNFRASSGYVTDPAGTTYILVQAYPQTRNGITFGWTSSTGALNSRDRSTGVNARVAGIMFPDSVGTFRVDLPAAGTYNIGCAIGDAAFDQGNQYIEIFDGAASLWSMQTSVGPGANQFYDVNGNLLTSDSDWFTNQTFKQLTFSGTILNVNVGKSGFGGIIAHLDVNQAASAPVARQVFIGQSIVRASYW